MVVVGNSVVGDAVLVVLVEGIDMGVVEVLIVVVVGFVLMVVEVVVCGAVGVAVGPQGISCHSQQFTLIS